MIQNRVHNCFIAALIHDIGKIILDKDGSWGTHEKMYVKNNPLLQDSKIDFPNKLGAELYTLAQAHGELPKITAQSIDDALSQLDKKVRNGESSFEVLALILADRLQKGMHGISDKTGHGIQQQFPHFFPYYGEDKRWDMCKSKEAIIEIDEKLSSPLNLKAALDVQELFQKFPHTTYIPHISLSLHHRFSAVLYYFLYKKLKACASLSELQELHFSVIQITPDPPNLLYRMKDVRIIRQAMERFRAYLIERVFCNHKSDLHEITKDTNPFEFFSGDSIVLLYDDADVLMDRLQSFINGDSEISTLYIKQFKYELKIKDSWKINNGQLSFFSNPDDLSVIEFQTTLLSTSLEQYPAITMHSCSKCNKPLKDASMDSKGDILCPSCLIGRKDVLKGINIEDVAVKCDEVKKIGFISIAIPEDMRDTAIDVARENLIKRFKCAKGKDETVNILTTKTGLFEYLQAVSDIGSFQRCLNQEIETIQHIYKEAAHTIYQSPGCVLFLLREDCYWSFLWFVLEERKKLHVPSAIKGALCDSHYPFWGLIDNLISYTKEDIYYDATERRTIMFTDGEVNSIRDMANMAKRERITNQLRILVHAALRSSLDELIMEIDVRERDNKLGRFNFAGSLKGCLQKLKTTGADYGDREKRSIFIKYITKLAQ